MAVAVGKNSLFGEFYHLKSTLWMHIAIKVKLKGKSLDIFGFCLKKPCLIKILTISLQQWLNGCMFV